MRPSRLALLLPMFVGINSCSDSTAAAALADFLLNYCDDKPAFVAIQATSDGAWTAVTLDGSNQATVKVGDKFGLAVVRTSGSSYSTYIYYVAKADLPTPTTTCASSSGSKTLNGSVATLTAGTEAQVTMDGVSAFLFAGGATSFSLSGVTNGAKDVIGQRRVSSTGLADKIIIRRAQDLATGTTMTQFNFAGTEAVTPASATVTYSGVAASDQRSLFARLSTVNNLTAFFNSPAAGSTSGTVYGLPAASNVATDIYDIGLSVYNSNFTAEHGVDLYKKAIADQTIAVGPALSTPTVTAASTTPKRLRLQLASQTDYNKLVEFFYYQSGAIFHSISITITANYLGGSPTTWDIQPPDLTAVAGYPTAAEFSSAAATWSVNAFGSTDAYFKETTDLADGTVLKWAYQSSGSATVLRAPQSSLSAQPEGAGRRGLRRAGLAGLPGR